jgi:hypothetical protein
VPNADILVGAFSRDPMNISVVSSPVNIWCALESTRGLTAVAASWRERLGDQFDPFKTALLQRAPGTPKGMPCPRGCACTHEIVMGDEWRVASDERKYAGGHAPPDTRPSSLRAICRCDPPNCPDIPLIPDDIVMLELSWNKLAHALCRVFSLDYKPADLGLLNTRQIGSWSVDAIPVILTVQHERAWFRTVLLELLARLRRRFILLAPTAKNLDAVSQELLASCDAAFFALDANIVLTADAVLRLSGARSPGELFAKFSPELRDTEENLASRAFALVHQLDSEETRRRPTVLTIFRMYCIDGLSAATIARKCRSTRVTVRQRLRLIEAKTGLKVDQLRKVSAHLEKAEASFADTRASHIHRKNLIYDDDDSNES